MGQNKGLQTNGKNQQPLELGPDIVKDIVAQKGQEIQLEFQKIKLEEKRIDSDTKLSEKAIEVNSQLMKEYPGQHRKNFITYAAFIIIIVFGVFIFIGYCLHTGNKEFAKELLSVISHLTTLFIGYLAGKHVTKKKNKSASAQPDEPEDAEIIDD